MNKTIKTIGLILLIMTAQTLYGQTTNEEKAIVKIREAIQLMDKGKLDESIKLLQEAQKLDPENLDISYELALAHYMKKDYEGAIKIMEKHIDHKNVTDQMFQIIANSYDMLGKPDKAFEYCDLGLKKFPNSGILYLSKGIVYEKQGKPAEAVVNYEKGIEVAPQFPSNYYRAALIFFNSTEEVWGMIYGEIFMNLERNTARTEQISKLLYDVYKSEIKFTKDKIEVSFSQNAAINVTDLANIGNMKLPFGPGVYEMTLLLSILPEKIININTLNTIRTKFVENYFAQGHNKTYPNVLFDYQKKVKDAGHLEAYNYWILMKGDEAGFDKWKSKNTAKWDNFVRWFTANGLKLDDKNKFYREQY